jgi:hypothetical protein
LKFRLVAKLCLDNYILTNAFFALCSSTSLSTKAKVSSSKSSSSPKSISILVQFEQRTLQAPYVSVLHDDQVLTDANEIYEMWIWQLCATLLYQKKQQAQRAGPPAHGANSFLLYKPLQNAIIVTNTRVNNNVYSNKEVSTEKADAYNNQYEGRAALCLRQKIEKQTLTKNE